MEMIKALTLTKAKIKASWTHSLCCLDEKGEMSDASYE